MPKSDQIKYYAIILMAIQTLSTSLVTAGTIYLYVENKTNGTLVAKNKNGTKEVKPHTTIDVGSVDGTPESGIDATSVALILPRLQETVYLKVAVRSAKFENTFFGSIGDIRERTALNWDISLNNSPLLAGENGPDSFRELSIKQNKNCNANTCLHYRITAVKKTYPVRAPDIYFTVEAI